MDAEAVAADRVDGQEPAPRHAGPGDDPRPRRAALEGDDRAAAWQTMLKAWPNYAKYEKTTGRLIPVFRLTRVS